MASLYRKKNSNIWYYSTSASGKHFQGSTRTSDKRLAMEVAKAIEADIIRNIHNIPAHNNNVYLFGKVFEGYLKNLSNADKTIKSKITASKHILPFFGTKDISKITLSDVEKYQNERRLSILSLPKNKNKRDSEISFRSVNIEISTLHHFFNYCIKKEILDKNPATGIKRLNELSRLKTLSDDDIQKLIAGATNKLTRDLITFLIYTGCRKGEALNLKWDDVDLKNDVIAVKGTKTKYDRHVPISKPLKELLKGVERSQDVLYAFNKNGARLTDFKRSFKTACRNAGLKDLRIHDLRHIFASKLVMNGASLYITGELLGHKTPAMTKKYSHLVPDTLRKAIDNAFSKD
ncbi:MAG: tyrosine-type recombinase/integrase [Deltaproteobacteria bacterium]|nr:tyrosine-type recombinase/integrase [Deltaproteobacteria bacterium]